MGVSARSAVLVCLSLLCLPASARAEVPDGLKAEDIVAGFRYNYSRFRSPRIVWRRTRQNTKAWHDANERSAANLERLSRAPGLPPDQRASFVEQAQNARSANEKGLRDVVSDADYWTDRRRYQVRIPKSQFTLSDSPRRNGDFPDEMPTPDALPTVFQDYCIASYDPEAQKPLRVWSGVDKDGTRTGLVALDTVDEYTVVFSFPPLGVDDRSWGSQWHPIDAFFALPQKEMKLLGTETLLGVTTYVLEHTRTEPYPEGVTKASGKVESATVTTAWVDPKRGYLPLRIEETSHNVYAGKRLGDPKLRQPYRVVEVSEISSIPEAGFFPTRGVIKTIGVDPNWNGTPLTLDEVIAGKSLATPIPTAVLEEIHWETRAVEPNKSMPPEIFALAFPDNTHYFDKTTSRGHIVGLSDEEVDRLMRGESTATSSVGRRHWWWLIAVNVILILGVGVVLIWRARKRRTN